MRRPKLHGCFSLRRRADFATADSRLYYGWIIVGLALVSLGFWFGIRSTFSIFYVVLIEEFSWSRAAAAGVQSTSLIVYMALAPAIGGLIDRYGPRRVIVPGVVLLGAGLILCAHIHNLAQFYLYYGLIVATGVAAVGIVSYSAILAHWFERQRGTANGIAVSGMGLGTFLLVILSQQIITRQGWRTAFAVQGGLVFLVLMPLTILFLKHRPQDMGLLPDGSDRSGSARRVRLVDEEWSQTEWTLGRAVRMGRFWAMLAFAFLVLIAVYIVLVHHVRFLVDHGVAPNTAAYVLAAIGVISSVFRIFWGWLSDRIGREATYTIGSIFLCLGIGALLSVAHTGAGWSVLGFLGLFGMGWGVTAPTFMSVSADLFHGRSYGLIYGVLEGTIGVGAALGSWLAGYMFDRTGSYQGAFAVAIAAIVLSCGFIWMVAPRKVRRMG
jgi:MFS family permease